LTAIVALLEGLGEAFVAAGADDLDGNGYSRPSSKSLSVTDWAWLGLSTVFSVSLEEVLLLGGFFLSPLSLLFFSEAPFLESAMITMRYIQFIIP
jgi:hypothetical protein